MPVGSLVNRLVIAGAPFDASPSANSSVRVFQDAFFQLLDQALGGRLARRDVAVHWFDTVDELARELTAMHALLGRDPAAVSFILFAAPGSPATMLQRKVNSLELGGTYVVSTKVLVYAASEWTGVAFLARRSPALKSFVLEHIRQEGLNGPALFALMLDACYDAGDVESLRDYWSERPDRATEPPPPAPGSRRPSQQMAVVRSFDDEPPTDELPLPGKKRRGDDTLSYPTEGTPSQLMRAVPAARETDPNAITQEIPTEHIPGRTKS